VYKTIVYGVFLLENAQTAAMTYGVYDSLITHFGDPNAVEKVQLTWFGIPVCAGISAYIPIYSKHYLMHLFCAN
jgi:hypothetical protein